MIPSMISMDGEYIYYQNGQMMDAQTGLPTPAEASDVQGTTQEHATAAFMTRLKAVADQLGDHTNVVRVTVKDHVEIMQKAVTSMQDHDDHNADWVKNQDTMVNDVAKSTSKKDVEAAQNTVQSENDPTTATPSSPAAQTASTASTPGSGTPDSEHM